MSVPPSDRDPALVLEHAPYVRALARSLVFDRELARDLEQDVLLAALENAPRDPHSMRGWLAAVVRNLASKAYRSRSRRQAREQRAARSQDAVPTPAEILAREDLRRWLVEHLLALDEPVRSVMILRFTEELPPREIARRLRIPLETVRTRVKRGLAELRGRLERDARGRNGAWCLALVCGLKIEPPSLVGAAFTLVGGAIPGVLALSTLKKILAAAVVVALATTVFFVSRQVEPLHPPSAPQVSVPAPEQLESSANTDSASASEPEQRSEVASEPVSAPLPSATDSSVLLKLHWHDGTPAAGVVARIYCNGAEDFYVDTHDVRTGEDGTCLCEDLPPGRVSAYLDRGPEGNCMVKAGEQATIELTLPRGFDISGIVVEHDGRPVAGAEILIDGMGNGWNGYSVDRSASDGTFHIRSYSSGLCWITARAPLHAPSAQVQILGEYADVEGVRIVFDGTGASVEGQVFDPRGEPLPHAQVLVGDPEAFEQRVLADGQQGRPPAAQLVLTDGAGHFRAAGTPVGKLQVQARARGCAPWRGEVETSEGASATLVIRMQKGTTLRGRARDSEGKPLKVGIEGNGEYGFAQRTRTSDSDGNFSVRDLPAGAFDVSASATGFEDAHAKLVGAPGAELVWNPVLGKGLAIRGQLVAPGIDFSKWWMYCESADWEKSSYAQSTAPKADGSFEFGGCADVKYKIRVHAPDASLYPVVSFEATPGGAPLLVTIDAAMLPSCRVRGRFVDEDGNPIAGANFTLMRSGANISPTSSAGPDGRFDLGPMPGGEYLVYANPTGYCVLRTEKAMLEPDANWDFGDLHVKRGGLVSVHLAHVSAKSVAIELAREGAESVWIRIEGDSGRSEVLEPGEYELHPWRDGQRIEAATAFPRVNVRAGEESPVELELP
ncbi:MAG: sigma-70 family RNA polymerase sigma factor [Planctomycetes bacterium]|nr:sigma-70 family RNA polymerase sigma factor [Planctomycetota bacterium]